jgi:hypothetical protein
MLRRARKALHRVCSSSSSAGLLRSDEVSVYCFTHDNTRRPAEQTEKFGSAAVEFARGLKKAALRSWRAG